MAAPVEDEQEADEHATEVGKVGNAVSSVKHAQQQFQCHHANDKPLGLDWYEEVEVDILVGEKHTEGQQQGIDCAAGSHADV